MNSTNYTPVASILPSKIRELMDIGIAEADICSLYVITTWIFEVFPMIAILRAIGPITTAKTRLIEGVLMPLVYRPFKTAGGSPTTANFRRSIMGDHKDGQATLVIEDVGFDVLPQTEFADIFISRCRQDGLASYQEVDGAGKFKRVSEIIFGPTLLGARLPFSDVAVESRILDIDMASQIRTKRVLADPPWDGDEEVIVALLQQFSDKVFGAPRPKKLARPEGIEDRVWDVSWPLAWIAGQTMTPAAMELVEEFLRLRSDAMSHDKAEEPVVMVIASIVALAESSGGLDPNPSIALSAIRKGIFDSHRVELSSHKIGRLCRSSLGLEVFTSTGQQKIRGIDWAMLRQVGARFGYKDELLESEFGDLEQ